MSLLDTASLVITPNGTKAGTLYSVVPSSGAGDMTVTRATTATRVNSAGLIESVASNVPRLDYSNGTCPSILVEPQRTNTILQSENLATSWTSFRSVVTTNVTNSPSGISNADKIAQQSGNVDAGGVFQTITLAIGTTYTYSFYAKAGGYNWTFARVIDGVNNYFVWFNLSSGVIGTIIGSATAKIENADNGWYRCSLTFTSAGLGNQVVTYVANADNSDQVPSPDSVKGIYIYGVQLEAGSYATSYIPTTSASVTRNADVISKTGISSLIGQISGTVFIDIDIDSSFAQANARFLDISSNNYDNWYFIGLANTNELAVYFRSNSTVYASALIPFTFGRKKIAFAYASNDYVAYMNGSLVHTDTSVVVGSTSKLTLANDFEFTSPSKQFTNSVALWKTRLTNTQLAQLTTI